MNAQRRPGRPRSEDARLRILGAAGHLIEREGYGHLTIEAIARSAGVSKQTIYRWWSSKAEVVLEALNEAASAAAPLPDTGALATDLRTLLRTTVEGVGANALILAALMAEAQLDQTFARSFRSGFLARRRQVLVEVLQRARARGEVGGSVDTDFLVEIVFGALWYRVLARNAPLDQAFSEQLADSALALAAEGTR